MDIIVWLWSTEGTMVHLVVKMSCGGDITAPSDHTSAAVPLGWTMCGLSWSARSRYRTR